MQPCSSDGATLFFSRRRPVLLLFCFHAHPGDLSGRGDVLTSAAVLRGGRGCPPLDAASLWLRTSPGKFNCYCRVCVWNGVFTSLAENLPSLLCLFCPRGPDPAPIPDAFFIIRSCGREELQGDKKGAEDEKQIPGLIFFWFLSPCKICPPTSCKLWILVDCSLVALHHLMKRGA